jgi:hypothetical protein
MKKKVFLKGATKPWISRKSLELGKLILKAEKVSLVDAEVLEVLESVYEIYSDNRAYYKALDEIIEAAQITFK